MKYSGIAAVLAAVSLPVLAIEVSLTVEEPIGADRAIEVVSGGIPFPQGQYKDPAGFSLFDGTTEVPVQVSPIVKYPDGSLHWALVSFPVSIKAQEKKSFVLKDSPGRAALSNPVVVRETGDLVEVSNGLVSFTVNKTNFNGFESVKFKGREVFKAAAAGLAANGKGGAARPISFEYYYRGPVKTTLYIKGVHGDQKAPTFSMAVTVNAGESAIHIAHNLRNGALGATAIQVTDPNICLGLSGELKATEGGAAPGSGGRPSAFGWQKFAGAADLLVFMRHGGPGNKGVYKIDEMSGELTVRLSPTDGSYRMDEGAHKSSEIDLVFGAAGVEALSEPLHARADCAYYSRYDGFGVGKGWGSLADETATYAAAGFANVNDPKKMPREKTDPMLYQTWFEAHATSECDHLQGMVFGYVRTGQRGYLDQASSWARYWRTYLLWRSDEWIYGKDGRYSTPKWGVARSCTEGCHFYGVGIFNYALITGEIDALEAAFDWAEMANVAWYGRYTGKKPGDSISDYGSRGFARSYLAVARAYDVARDRFWQESLLHYVNVAVKANGRDPRGFTTSWSSSNPGSAAGGFKDKAALEKIIQDEKIEISGNMVKHPRYGEYRPLTVSSWPEAMESMANYMAYEALSDSPDPACQLAAEDAMDYCIAESYLGLKYLYNAEDNCVYYYMSIDYPLPDDRAGGSKDSWYTKWWPNTMGYGYRLTGDKALKARMVEMLWWGLSRDYVNPPRVPVGEAPIYARVEHNTKGDWMTPTAFAFGVGANPRQDEASPQPVTDLKAVARENGQVDLTWTAPRDEGGKVVRYQVKYAGRPIKDYMDINHREEFRAVAYWNMAANVLGEPAPQSPGKAEKMTVALPAGKTIWLAVRSFDAEHNRSGISNVVKVEPR